MTSSLALVFDLDGTLVDSASATLAALARATIAHGLEPLPEPDARRLFVGPDLRQALEEHYRLKDDPLDALIRSFRRTMEPKLEGILLFPGIAELLHELRQWQSVVNTAVLTNRIAPFANAIITSVGLEGYFTSVMSNSTESGDTLRTGPTKTVQMITHADALRQSALDTTIVVVGDRREDALAANAVGAHFLRARWGYGPDADFRDLTVEAELDSPRQVVLRLLEL